MIWKPAFALCIALALSGCMLSGTNVSDAQIDQFVRGKTTQDEVVAKLGPPTSRNRAASGETTLMYSYTKMSPTAATFIPLVGGLFAGVDMKGKLVSFTFTKAGVLKDWTASENDMSSNNGLLNQH
jgi:outer membrane protein assembly factor BamE (lipoprotein component of BamABCDE complex)